MVNSWLLRINVVELTYIIIYCRSHHNRYKICVSRPNTCVHSIWITKLMHVTHSKWSWVTNIVRPILHEKLFRYWILDIHMYFHSESRCCLFRYWILIIHKLMFLQRAPMLLFGYILISNIHMYFYSQCRSCFLDKLDIGHSHSFLQRISMLILDVGHSRVFYSEYRCCFFRYCIWDIHLCFYSEYRSYFSDIRYWTFTYVSTAKIELALYIIGYWALQCTVNVFFVHR